MIVDANLLVFLHVVNPAFTPEATRAAERADVLHASEIGQGEPRLPPAKKRNRRGFSNDYLTGRGTRVSL